MADKDKQSKRNKNVIKGGGSSGIWFLGFIGTLVYYLHVHSGTFWLVVLGFIKAVFWPAILVYHLFLFLHI